MIWAALLMALLVVLYMAQPRFKRFRLSSARFFKEMPVPRERRFRFSVSRPELSRVFWLQLLALALILLAFLLRQRTYKATASGEGQGVWVLVDTSASMSTKQAGKIRAELVAESIKQTVEEANSGVKRRFRLSLFDMEVREVALPDSTLGAVLNREDDWKPRPLGTDLARLRALPPPEDSFPITHLLVVTDRPAPDWIAEVETPRIVWRDLSAPVENVGITAIQGARNPLTGRVSSFRVEVEASRSSASPSGLSLAITGPNGRRVERAFKSWTRRERSFSSEVEIPAETPGEYQLELNLDPETSSYVFDDAARIKIPASGELKVDWQLPDRRIPDLLGWKSETERPAFRVAAFGTELNPADSALLIATGAAAKPDSILDFQEAHPLLTDVNLDAVETLALPAVELGGPGDELRPVLRRDDGKAWLAEGKLAPGRGSRYVLPGLPQLTFDASDNREAFLLTTFFNATRALLSERPPAPLYTLTTPANPVPQGTRLVLHPDEGDTTPDARSVGGFDEDRYDLPGEKRPFWPLALAACAVVLAVERSLAAWGGSKWR